MSGEEILKLVKGLGVHALHDHELHALHDHELYIEVDEVITAFDQRELSSTDLACWRIDVTLLQLAVKCFQDFILVCIDNKADIHPSTNMYRDQQI